MNHPGNVNSKKRRAQREGDCDDFMLVYMKRKYYERDLAYLAMIDSFTQDAPQLLLQVTLLLSLHSEELQHWETAVSQLGSVTLSLLSLSMSLVSYSQALRWADANLPTLPLSSQLVQVRESSFSV